MEINIIKAVLVLVFDLPVLGKVIAKTKLVFEKTGYSKRVMYATAIVEIILTIGLFTKYELFATIGLVVIIADAVFTLLCLRIKPP